MTLKEKFLELAFAKISSEELRDESVQVAEEFAIGFGQWLVSNCYSEDDIYWWLIKTGGDVRKSTEELLEIYKKEKGL
jgi:hypothetical protein